MVFDPYEWYPLDGTDDDALHAFEAVRGDADWNAGVNYHPLCGATRYDRVDYDGGYCTRCLHRLGLTSTEELP